ncbi:L-threonine 3-dehydrogenase [Thermosipho melanesiensis]|uniref:Alcohol dehydrogenase GroES domain protein n=2 Tax=Thermosipho melanesiensis TaxID=46541 RepID=A6LMP5_THEM4|nr:L-threonine 3-dehydrogenase [Thermosipho melanesiensis]ABR31196.1 Alcohol dehydrogenase GroES domain protein [Thermosipho melanesiensis BI429]APT74285.1 L-threonine 3-dehydrogenase [Thermosipho melanesiensis]OOC36224.1 L-threonine 3-dehydrogenase [Thermosipho melanesiensis]OOC37042.1 L-threonine 3-dehydrogenase [Thermosipho melanesiensis]OOC37794.1 L-threonine 3-dehydrogenase [Thermosipho melanesiensis]
MKAILKENAGPGFTMRDVNKPEKLGPRDVLVKIRRASICGTDVHIYKWDEWSQSRIKPPLIVGHEMAGEVVEVGEAVTQVKVGDLVSAETHIPCEHCYQCKTGRMHVCKNLEILGVDRNGVFTEYAVIPETVLWKFSKEIPLDFASVMEPFGNAVHTALVSDLTGKKVLITGSGPIGLMAIQVAKAAGASLVITTEVDPLRIEMAKENGADIVINPLEQDLVKSIYTITNDGVDILLEMSGNKKALEDGLKCVTMGGEASLLGIFGGSIDINLDSLVIMRGITVYGITGRRMFDTWKVADELLKNKKVDLSKVVTHVLPFDQWEKGFELMLNKKCGKVVLNLD